MTITATSTPLSRYLRQIADHDLDDQHAKQSLHEAADLLERTPAQQPTAWRYRIAENVKYRGVRVWGYSDSEPNDDALYEKQPLYAAPLAEGASGTSNVPALQLLQALENAFKDDAALSYPVAGGRLTRMQKRIAKAKMVVSLVGQIKGALARQSADANDSDRISQLERLIDDAAVAIQGVLTDPGEKDEWDSLRAVLPRLQRELEDETCGRCMGTGYSNHPDSGEVCNECKGRGGVPACRLQLALQETVNNDSESMLDRLDRASGVVIFSEDGEGNVLRYTLPELELDWLRAILRGRRSPAESANGKGNKPVAWRWMNTAHPELGWTYTEQEVKEHPSLLLKVEPLTPLHCPTEIAGNNGAHSYPNEAYKGQITIDVGLLHALWCYGNLNPVRNVVYGYGTHDACLKKADRLIADRAANVCCASQPDSANVLDTALVDTMREEMIALRAQVEAAAWQPVEAAPKDGTPVTGAEMYRYLPYKPDGRRQMKADGRWQRWNGFGWDNSPAPDAWRPALSSTVQK